MQFYTSTVSYAQTTFPKNKAWDPDVLPASLQTDVCFASIAVVPEGKHDVTACAGFEAQWRRVVPGVLSSLEAPELACFVWAVGPLLDDGLIRVFPHIVSIGNDIARYSIEGVDFLEESGYRYGRVVFEYRRDAYEELMADDGIDLEYTKLYVMFFPEACVAEAISKSFDEIGIRWIVEHNCLALAPFRHFEGYYLVGRTRTVDAALRRVE